MSDDPYTRFAHDVHGSDVAPATAPTVASVATRANTHAVGYAGIATGAGGLSLIIFAVGRLFAALSDPQTLFDLIAEHDSHTFGHASATIAACLFGVLGAVVLTALGLLAAYLGRPRNIPQKGPDMKATLAVLLVLGALFAGPAYADPTPAPSASASPTSSCVDALSAALEAAASSDSTGADDTTDPSKPQTDLAAAEALAVKFAGCADTSTDPDEQVHALKFAYVLSGECVRGIFAAAGGAEDLTADDRSEIRKLWTNGEGYVDRIIAIAIKTHDDDLLADAKAHKKNVDSLGVFMKFVPPPAKS